MGEPLRQFLLAQWRRRVDGRYMYRGMSAKDLTGPLRPAVDPFLSVREDLYRLLDLLQDLLDAGLAFTVHEDYSGLSFDLRNIVSWTRGDLDHPGIDFTSSYESACGYAHNYQGSQLKQNMRYITEHLPERKDDPPVSDRMTEDDWALVQRINRWVLPTSPDHKMVVIWVPRLCPAFETDRPAGLPLGGFEHFCNRVLARINHLGLAATPESVEYVLPDETAEFCHRLTRPLLLSNIEKVEEVTDGSWRP